MTFIKLSFALLLLAVGRGFIAHDMLVYFGLAENTWFIFGTAFVAGWLACGIRRDLGRRSDSPETKLEKLRGLS